MLYGKKATIVIFDEIQDVEAELRLAYDKIDELARGYRRNRRQGALIEKRMWERKARELQEKKDETKR